MIEAACTDGRLLIAPDTSAKANMERLNHAPVPPAEFEAIYGAVTRSDGGA